MHYRPASWCQQSITTRKYCSWSSLLTATCLSSSQLAGTMMIRDLQAHVPAGTYTVIYDGEGMLDYSMDVTAVRHVEAGRTEVDVKPSTGTNNGA